MVWNSLQSLLNRSAFLRKWKLLSRIWLFVTPWNSPGQNTGAGTLSLLQVIFPTQGSNPGLSHCRQILYQLSHKGSPRILEWVAYPLLWWIFPAQESNQGLLHCRWILYQLSYQGSFFRKERWKLGTSDYGSGMHFFLVCIFWFVDFSNYKSI